MKTTEQILDRIQEIRNEISFLDNLSNSSDDVNIHCIEDQIHSLQLEKWDLESLLEQSFDDLIGL
jgi:hypothetical protein